jgi:hypothetical protein
MTLDANLKNLPGECKTVVDYIASTFMINHLKRFKNCQFLCSSYNYFVNSFMRISLMCCTVAN